MEDSAGPMLRDQALRRMIDLLHRRSRASRSAARPSRSRWVDCRARLPAPGVDECMNHVTADIAGAPVTNYKMLAVSWGNQSKVE